MILAPPVVALLTNASASSPEYQWKGGQGLFALVGTLGGATVTLEFMGPDGATFLPVGASTTLNAAGSGLFFLPPCIIKAVVSGGAPSGLYATAYVIPYWISGATY